ncbi:hypothetical protein ACQP1O_13470 [Nocardia sp. CA-151230]|uniref:hypothetical protein n=1 Tax=Nocardia sp. CA-151230 TaxID=3239982 RepID=UPI003D940E05
MVERNLFIDGHRAWNASTLSVTAPCGLGLVHRGPDRDVCEQPRQVDAQMPGNLTQRVVECRPHGPRLGVQPDNGARVADFDVADLVTAGAPGDGPRCTDDDVGLTAGSCRMPAEPVSSVRVVNLPRTRADRNVTRERDSPRSGLQFWEARTV